MGPVHRCCGREDGMESWKEGRHAAWIIRSEVSVRSLLDQVLTKIFAAESRHCKLLCDLDPPLNYYWSSSRPHHLDARWSKQA